MWHVRYFLLFSKKSVPSFTCSKSDEVHFQTCLGAESPTHRLNHVLHVQCSMNIHVTMRGFQTGDQIVFVVTIVIIFRAS